VSSAGGRTIDIVAEGTDGAEIIIENQYGRADHDHLTRGLAYAVARRAKGLVVVAEEHRAEFRAVAEYLNDLAKKDAERGIAVWLVEARAVRILDSPWAPLFTAVIEPNAFTASVEPEKQSEALGSIDDFWQQFKSEPTLAAAQEVLKQWDGSEHLDQRRLLGPNHIVLESAGPSVNGFRTVVAIYSDGRVMVPFSSYAGKNSGIPIEALTTNEFRSEADRLFRFKGSELLARTAPGWLTPERVSTLVEFCEQVPTTERRSSRGLGAERSRTATFNDQLKSRPGLLKMVLQWTSLLGMH
jgi:hypothetical protein